MKMLKQDQHPDDRDFDDRSDSKSSAMTSVGKALALLRAFPDVPTGLTELARLAHVPKSTAFRLLQALESDGLVEKAGTSYRLGQGAFQLGLSRSSTLRALREAAVPVLVDLHRAVELPVHFGVLKGAEVLYLEKVVGLRAMPLATFAGVRLPAHCTAVGKALLSGCSSEVLSDLLPERLEMRTQHTLALREHLEVQLEQVRSFGYSTELEEIKLGVACVGAPIFGPTGRVIAALSIAAPVHHSQRDGFPQLVCKAATTISATVPMSVKRALEANDPREHLAAAI